MKTVFPFFFAAVFFISCENTRYAYSPTAHNVPILAKQGDSKLAANYSTNGAWADANNDNNQYEKKVAHGFDLQGAMAVTNHIAVQANYFYRRENSSNTYNSYNFDSSTVRYKRNLAEVGAGFFSPFDAKDRILFQVFAGIGFGKTTIDDKGRDFNLNPYTRYYNTSLTKYFLEPAITFRTRNEIFAASIGSRLSLIKFRNISTNYSFEEKQDLNLDSLNRFAVLFFEPAFVGSFGFNKLPGFRIEFQTGLSVLADEEFIDYRPFNFSIGLVFDIRKLMKKAGQ